MKHIVSLVAVVVFGMTCIAALAFGGENSKELKQSKAVDEEMINNLEFLLFLDEFDEDPTKSSALDLIGQEEAKGKKR